MKRCHFNPNTAMICIIPAVVTFNFIVTGDFFKLSGQLTISECQPSGRINISDDGNTQSTFTCNGFHANETVQWVLRRDGMQTFSVKCGQTCDYTDSNVNVSRPMGSSSTFTIARSFWEKQEYANVVCTSAQNASNFYTCYTNVIPTTTTEPHTQVSPLFSSATTYDHTQENLEMAPAKDPFPSAAVGGGVAAVVVVVIVVVMAVVFYKRRSQESDKTSKQTADTRDYDNSAVADASAIEESAKGPYASLEMSEIGLKSVYSDLTHISPASLSGTDYEIPP